MENVEEDVLPLNAAEKGEKLNPWLTIWSAINYYVGKLLKGKGTYEEMRVATAISFIPFAISGVFLCFRCSVSWRKIVY